MQLHNITCRFQLDLQQAEVVMTKAERVEVVCDPPHSLVPHGREDALSEEQWAELRGL